MARCLRCNAGNEWIEGNAAKSVPLDETDERIADLERQLDEAKALLAVRIQESNEWEALARDRQEEIEAMRPVVDAAMWHERVFRKIKHSNCGLCKRVREYEARKQP